jgi:hypothetical protein
MPADADKRTYVIFRFWLCSHKPSLPTKEKIISRALAHPVGLLRKLHCEPAAWIVHKSFPPQRMSKVGGCRTFESVSLLSIGKARSADKILAWAVRPRECEKRRIALKVRRRSLRSIPRTISANWLQHRTLLHAPISRACRFSISIAPSALDRYGDVSLGLTAQAIIASALRAFPTPAVHRPD